ncbi:GDSL-type esterase/lipase family protein [Amycolatopsis sp. YIM 10]|uniref:SGNH/GDSL hydrolase family protein n=1 Tax=Amycolatopsis sp. YIM 10 TaxID=2653857 RepID=UPI00128FD174|nr:GDSL-type esterase/lipase family protein [Amycolatopsis sp. YIM 10]QFU88436.1 GDSL-like Lipase/Acylhydrolase [Amycolatopsis sp. YIM 10]
MNRQILTRKRVLVAAALVLVATLGTVGIAGYLAFLRAPANTPAEACGGGATSRPAVVSAGASMTQGTLGGDWVGDLRGRPEFAGYEFVNAGHNGDTAADLLARVDTDVVACRPAAVLVLVGSNDVRDGTPLERYRADLTAIVDRLRTGTTARIALLSLPPLGEDLTTDINRSLAGYNAAIEETAGRSGVDFLPVHRRMLDLLGPDTDRRPYDFSFPLALSAATRHYVLGQSWDDIARGGGRALLIDHIHLNDRGAARLADVAAEWLTATP